jgi:hypothetical protein
MRQAPTSATSDGADPDTLAAKAVDALRRAWVAHYEFPLLFRTSPDLRSLQGRPDLQLLLMDMKFPPNPFE